MPIAVYGSGIISEATLVYEGSATNNYCQYTTTSNYSHYIVFNQAAASSTANVELYVNGTKITSSNYSSYYITEIHFLPTSSDYKQFKVILSIFKNVPSGTVLKFGKYYSAHARVYGIS